MSSVKEQILSQLEDTLERVDDCEGRIYRSRPEAFTREESPAINFYPVSATVSDPYVMTHLVWLLSIRFVIVARSEGDKTPDEVADAVLIGMHSKIYADTTLDALCIGIYPRSINYQIVEGDNNACAIICDYEFQYRTALADLTEN